MKNYLKYKFSIMLVIATILSSCTSSQDNDVITTATLKSQNSTQATYQPSLKIINNTDIKFKFGAIFTQTSFGTMPHDRILSKGIGTNGNGRINPFTTNVIYDYNTTSDAANLQASLWQVVNYSSPNLSGLYNPTYTQSNYGISGGNGSRAIWSGLYLEVNDGLNTCDYLDNNGILDLKGISIGEPSYGIYSDFQDNSNISFEFSDNISVSGDQNALIIWTQDTNGDVQVVINPAFN